MKNRKCLEGETVSVEKGDNVIFPNIDSCTCIVFVLSSGAIEAAHHVITEKGQDFTAETPKKNADRLIKTLINDAWLRGKKVTVKQIIFLSPTINWGLVDWDSIQTKLQGMYNKIPVTLVELSNNQVDVYVYSGLQMIEIHKRDSVTGLSFQTCMDRLQMTI